MVREKIRNKLGRLISSWHLRKTRKSSMIFKNDEVDGNNESSQRSYSLVIPPQDLENLPKTQNELVRSSGKDGQHELQRPSSAAHSQDSQKDLAAGHNNEELDGQQSQRNLAPVITPHDPEYLSDTREKGTGPNEKDVPDGNDGLRQPSSSPVTPSQDSEGSLKTHEVSVESDKKKGLDEKQEPPSPYSPVIMSPKIHARPVGSSKKGSDEHQGLQQILSTDVSSVQSTDLTASSLSGQNPVSMPASTQKETDEVKRQFEVISSREQSAEVLLSPSVIPVSTSETQTEELDEQVQSLTRIRTISQLTSQESLSKWPFTFDDISTVLSDIRNTMKSSFKVRDYHELAFLRGLIEVHPDANRSGPEKPDKALQLICRRAVIVMKAVQYGWDPFTPSLQKQEAQEVADFLARGVTIPVDESV